MSRFFLAVALVTIPGTFLRSAEPAAKSNSSIVVESVVLTIASQSHVSAREAGLLNELLVREGQRVNAGELLARLDDEEAKLAYQRALLDLERAQKLGENDFKIRLARKQLEIALAELKRASHAADRFNKSVTEAELDRLKLDVERATLEVQQAEFELDTARLLIRVQENELQSATEKARRRRITAPITGTVVEVHKRLGEWVETGEKVVRIIGTDKLRAEGFLDVSRIQCELVGRRVTFVVHVPRLDNEPANEGQKERAQAQTQAQERFSGSIVFVSPEVDPVNRQVRIKAEIENLSGRLNPGLSGELAIEPE